ncbi:hypothetical protein GJ633_04100 [Halorubrum sp. CBA1125]|uniref:hypothetical protein n=1 Tax=Halorubrum sp. CBA1125 TaxID=2668072 RepID=UPI0012E7D7B2|nr:hypothetical protein [Halorubrum sp. CBA1125]MUW13934.1 hypothetical protein [Halorubrum sp. CBA1125]
MIGQKAMAKKLLNRVDITELGVTQAVAGGLAEIERAQAEAVRDLAEAHDFDVDVKEPDPEERRDLLLRGAEAAADGNGVEWWLDERHGHRLDDPEAAVEYAKMSPDEWDAQIERWAEFYRSNGYGADRSDRDLAAVHVRETFGVDLDWFEETIVGLDRAEVLRQLLAGNLESIEFAIRDAAEQEPDPPTDE